MKKITLSLISLLWIFTSCTKEDEKPVYLPKVVITNASASEGAALIFKVEIDSASTNEISLSFSITGNTAVAGEDFTDASGITNLVFLPGEKSKEIIIGTVNDTRSESDETLTVKLSDCKNAVLIISEATGTIKNVAVAQASYYLEAVIGTKTWKAQASGVFSASAFENTFSLSGFGAGTDYDSQVAIVLGETWTVKKFTVQDNPLLSEGKAFASYAPHFFSGGGMGTLYVGYEGEVDVQSVDIAKKIVSGTFYFKAKDEKNNLLTISSGKFKLPLE